MSGTRQFTQRYLAPGARIQLIAPAGPFDVNAFEQGVTRLRRRYDVNYEPEIIARQGYLAGSDARRVDELRRALLTPNVDAIIAARGGYGATRISSQIDLALIRRRAPLLVGFSDITALHALWAKAEVGSLHGSMVAQLGRVTEPLFERFVAALEGRFPNGWTGLEAITPGRAEGILLGGNLAVLCALLGTSTFPQLDDTVLFLEDIGERPYRVDRMLTSLREAGVLANVRAVVLGAFVQADPGPDGVTACAVLRERLSDLGVPVLMGLAAGHVDDNAELPFGRTVSVDADAGRVDLHDLHDPHEWRPT
jgi:muramoyltetrapeptide carboxypeptidase